MDVRSVRIPKDRGLPGTPGMYRYFKEIGVPSWGFRQMTFNNAFLKENCASGFDAVEEFLRFRFFGQ